MKKVRLGEVCDILDNKRIPITAANRISGPYPYYGANGVQDYVADYIFDDELVLLAEDGGYFGSKDKPIAYRVSGKCWVNNHAHVLKPKNNINVDYLCYSLMFYDVSNLVNGATRQKLTQADMLCIEIPLCSIEKQKYIVQLLDKVSELIALRKQQLAKLDELVKSRFVEMFGDLSNPQCQWEMCQLKEVCKSTDDIKCGPFGTQLGKEEYRKEGIAVWEIPQINSSFMSPPTDFVSEEKAKQLSAYSIIPGDIAMSRKGNVGKCAIFPEQYASGIIHSDVLRIRVNKQKVVPKFMMYQLRISKAVEAQIAIVSSGAIMAGINVTKLKNINVHIPPMELQKQFTCFIDKIDSLNSDIEKSLEELNLVKKSLMQEYFA